MFTRLSESDIKMVLKELKKDHVVISKKEFSEKVKAGMMNAKQTGKHPGRPPKLQPDQVCDILDMVDAGIPYREIAKKYNISKMSISRIKNKKLHGCKQSMGLRSGYSDANQRQIPSTTPDIMAKLRAALGKRGMRVDEMECQRILSEIFSDDDIRSETRYEYYEYQPSRNYIEMTLHALNKKQN